MLAQSSRAADSKLECQVCLRENMKTVTTDSNPPRRVCCSCRDVFYQFSKLFDEETSQRRLNDLLRCKCSALTMNAENRQTAPGICRACRFRKCQALEIFTVPTSNQPIDFKQLPCSICSRPSSGHHYGAITCDSCKSFFSRTVQHRPDQMYRCERNVRIKRTPRELEAKNQRTREMLSSHMFCQPHEHGKFNCKFCRFCRCLAVGMSMTAFRRGRHSYYIREKIRETMIPPSPKLSKKSHSGSTSSSSNDNTSVLHGTMSPNSEKMTHCGSFQDSSHDYGDLSVLKGDEAPLTLNENYFLEAKPAELRQKYDSTVAFMKQNYQVSPYFWLYGSARKYLNLDQYNQYDLPSLDDPLRLLDRFFKWPQAFHENSSALFAETYHADTEWLFYRIVVAMRTLQNVSMNSLRFREGISQSEAWFNINQNILDGGRYILNTVRMLPGFESLTVADRKRLFSAAYFPILSAQQCVSCNEGKDNLDCIFDASMSQQSKSQLHDLFKMDLNTERLFVEVGKSLKNADFCIIEYGLMVAMLFFDPQVAGLEKADTVEEILRRYRQAHEMFVRYDYSKILQNATGGGEIATQQRIDRCYSEQSNVLMISCVLRDNFLRIRDHWPDLVDGNPFLSDLLSTISSLKTSVVKKG